MNLSKVALPFEGKRIWQDTASMGVSTASALLYEAAMIFKDRPMKVYEMGCGTGIVSIMCALSRPTWQITGIDIQKNLIDLAIENAKSCEVNCLFFCEDLKEHKGEYELILSNPPWRKVGSGMMSKELSRNQSRFELSADMDDIFDALQSCMTDNGEALLLYPADRLAELKEKAAIRGFSCRISLKRFAKKSFFIASLNNLDR